MGNWRPSGSATTWTSVSAGIEQLVASAVASPPGGSPVATFWDRPVFESVNPLYPSNHGVNYTNAIVGGWGLDWASGTPTFLAVVADWGFTGLGAETSGYSTNGGGTWSTFGGLPSEAGGTYWGGSIAVSTTTNFVWSLSNCGDPFYTTNGGSTWTKITLPSGISSNDCGWSANYYLDRQNVIADRKNNNVFYLYYAGSAGPGAGIYKSVNSGATWTLALSGHIAGADGFNLQMQANPLLGGDFLLTAGNQGCSPAASCHPVSQNLYECTDSAPTNGSNPVVCNAFTNVKEAWSAGWGKPNPGGSGYSAIYFFGWVSGAQGVWESDNDGLTWTNLAPNGWANNSLDEVKYVSGDNSIYGTVYVGFAGSGIAAYH